MAKDRERQLPYAIEAMNKMGIFQPYIEIFQEKGVVTLFENFGGYYIEEDNERDLYNKIQSFEKTTGHLVYTVTHERAEDNLYTFYIVPANKCDWGEEVEMPYAWAYTWNKTIESFSEYGSVMIKSFGGGIKRIE